jgi:hypothetical protein
MRPQSQTWAMIVATTIVVTLSMVAVDSHAWLRAPLVLAFLAVVPGLAIARLLGIADAFAEIVIGTALSIALASGVSASLLYTGYWVPESGLGILMGIALAATGVEVARARRSQSGNAL